MKFLKKSLKNKGFILPTTLFIITFLVWIFSMILLSYKTELDSFIVLKSTNDEYWLLENLSTVAEYEIFKGESLINENEYDDIIQYFEDKDLVWIEKDKISKSGYKRLEVKHNDKFILHKVELVPFMRNKLEIKLFKELNIEDKKINIEIKLFYEYLFGETDILKSFKREIQGVDVILKNENIRN
ncbi:hypothetical protein ACQ9ZF_08560 [Cetobacterium somerae]|uniref:hypothetical protein n=1 Tax=Cetobacterium somerae TaxID=188913 RepID=UPI003D7687A9